MAGKREPYFHYLVVQLHDMDFANSRLIGPKLSVILINNEGVMKNYIYNSVLNNTFKHLIALYNS